MLAWDGWYLDGAPDQSTPVTGLDFDDWDDMPSKLLVRANQPWLASDLAYWLVPEYSVARSAADLVAGHSDGETSGDNARQFQRADLVAYLPIVDIDVFRRRLGEMPRSLSPGAAAVIDDLNG